MQYHGGKSQTYKQIAKYVDELVLPTGTVWEPFMGGAWVTSAVTHRPLRASDANEYMVAAWQAIADGWIPPHDITEQTYHHVKANPNEDKALTGFVGTGLSFGGKWWGGFARPNKGHPLGYAGGQSRSCLRKAPGLCGVEISVRDYREITPQPGDLVYCDPPYFNTSNGYKKSGFDPVQFWEWARHLPTKGVTVLVSEVSAPHGIQVLATFPVLRKSKNQDGKGERKTEYLYILNP